MAGGIEGGWIWKKRKTEECERDTCHGTVGMNKDWETYHAVFSKTLNDVGSLLGNYTEAYIDWGRHDVRPSVVPTTTVAKKGTPLVAQRRIGDERQS